MIMFHHVIQNLNGRDSDSENELDKLEEIETCLQEHDPDFKKFTFAIFTSTRYVILYFYWYFLIIKCNDDEVVLI